MHGKAHPQVRPGPLCGVDDAVRGFVATVENAVPRRCPASTEPCLASMEKEG
jgi:hypothetical protein